MNDMTSIVDKAFKIDIKIKKLQEEMKKLKAEMIKEARSKKHDVVLLHGSKCYVQVTKKTTRIIEPETLQNALKQKRQGSKFHECVTVNIGKTSSYFSSDELDELADDLKISRCVTFKK